MASLVTSSVTAGNSRLKGGRNHRPRAVGKVAARVAARKDPLQSWMAGKKRMRSQKESKRTQKNLQTSASFPS